MKKKTIVKLYKKIFFEKSEFLYENCVSVIYSLLKIVEYEPCLYILIHVLWPNGVTEI